MNRNEIDLNSNYQQWEFSSCIPVLIKLQGTKDVLKRTSKRRSWEHWISIVTWFIPCWLNVESRGRSFICKCQLDSNYSNTAIKFFRMFLNLKIILWKILSPYSYLRNLSALLLSLIGSTTTSRNEGRSKDENNFGSVDSSYL